MVYVQQVHLRARLVQGSHCPAEARERLLRHTFLVGRHMLRVRAVLNCCVAVINRNDLAAAVGDIGAEENLPPCPEKETDSRGIYETARQVQELLHSNPASGAGRT